MVQGSGQGDSLAEFTGSLDALRAALTTLSFTPTTDFSGDAALELMISHTSDPGLNERRRIDIIVRATPVVRQTDLSARTSAFVGRIASAPSSAINGSSANASANSGDLVWQPLSSVRENSGVSELSTNVDGSNVAASDALGVGGALGTPAVVKPGALSGSALASPLASTSSGGRDQRSGGHDPASLRDPFNLGNELIRLAIDADRSLRFETSAAATLNPLASMNPDSQR